MEKIELRTSYLGPNLLLLGFEAGDVGVDLKVSEEQLNFNE